MAEFYQIARKLDSLIDGEVDDNSIKNLLSIISMDTAYADYLFRTIRDLRWFKPLKDEGCFEPKPSLQPINTEDGGLIIPTWNVLQFLEYVSEQTSNAINEKLSFDLQKIIKNVTNYHINNQRALDNFRIWYSFINIICNLPNKTISLDVIKLVEIWLDTKIGMSAIDIDLTKRLIPKFLNSRDSADLEKAEILVVASTMIQMPSKPSHDEEHSIKKVDPNTVVESYWLRNLFKKYNDKIAKTCTIKSINSIAERLISILKWEHGKAWRVVEHGNTKYLIDISLTEVDDFILTVGIIEDKSNSIKEEALFGKRPTSAMLSSFLIEDVSDVSEFKQLAKQKFAENSTLTGLVSSWEDNFLTDLFESLFLDYSYIWFPTLYNNPSVGESRADVTLVIILKDLILAKAKYDTNAICEVIENLNVKKYSYPILNRIALYLIGNKWDDFNDVFYEMLETDGIKFFNDSHYEKEIYKILEINSKKLDEKQKKIIKRIVEQGPSHIQNNLGESKKVAAWKQKWYFPLKSVPEFGNLYKECTKIVKVPQNRLLRKTTSSVRSGPGPSPLTVAEILDFPVKNLVLYLKEFQTKDTWNGPTVGGLSQVFKEAVKSDIHRFTQNLPNFHNSGFIYIYEILSAFHDACREKKVFDWCKIFDFIYIYINRESFWKDKFIVEKGEWLGGADHFWIIGIIAELIEEGTKTNSYVFEPKYNKRAKEILYLILNKLSPDNDDISEYVSHALNSSAGKVITSFIYLVLKIVRDDSKADIDRSVKWEQEYRMKYEELLEAPFIEAYTLLGRYLPNFFYIDKEWVSGKISEFETLQKEPQWEAFMDGYFSIGKLYDDVFDLMKKHYSYSILYQFKDKHNREYLVQHISLAYLREKEGIDFPGGNLRKLLQNWNTDDIKIMIDFFWSQRDTILKDKRLRKLVLQFWWWIYNNRYKNNEIFENKEISILARLAKFGIFLRTIDNQAFELLRISVPYIEGFKLSYVIKYFAEFEEKESIKFAGKLLLILVESRKVDHEKDGILSIVKKLYKNGEKEVANGICNAFGMKGDDFLRKIYYKLNPVK